MLSTRVPKFLVAAHTERPVILGLRRSRSKERVMSGLTNGHIQPAKIITLDYSELVDGTVDKTSKIEEGFGPDGLGIVTVASVPDLVQKRKQLLMLIDKFANLPDHIRKKYEDPKGGLAGVGWSRGIETLEDGKPDLNKGSYYANPLHDVVTEEEGLLKAYPSYTTSNLWPTEDLPELREAFRDLGSLIIEIGFLVARACDQYVSQRNPSFERGRLEGILKSSMNPKGRLLHYYPPKADEPNSNWCARHTDHGSLTGLVSALYSKDGKEVPNPDPSSGLYISSRSNEAVKAPIPASHVAFQMGEAMQVHSGGLLRATPHFVKMASGPASEGVARNTLAIFMQPSWDEAMDLPKGADPGFVGIGQWKQGINFGEFSELTIQQHHRPSKMSIEGL